MKKNSKIFARQKICSTFAIPTGNNAEIAQLVERNLAKVEVAGPSPVFRSKREMLQAPLFFCIWHYRCRLGLAASVPRGDGATEITGKTMCLSGRPRKVSSSAELTARQSGFWMSPSDCGLCHGPKNDTAILGLSYADGPSLRTSSVSSEEPLWRNAPLIDN